MRTLRALASFAPASHGLLPRLPRLRGVELLRLDGVHRLLQGRGRYRRQQGRKGAMPSQHAPRNANSSARQSTWPSLPSPPSWPLLAARGLLSFLAGFPVRYSLLRGRITLTSPAVLDLCSKFDCMGELVVYRMTFGLALFHIFLSLLMIGVRDSSDWRFSLQNGTSSLHMPHILFSCDRRVVDCEGACARRSHRHRLRYSHRFLRGTLRTCPNCPTYPVLRRGAGFA